MCLPYPDQCSKRIVHDSKFKVPMFGGAPPSLPAFRVLSLQRSRQLAFGQPVRQYVLAIPLANQYSTRILQDPWLKMRGLRMHGSRFQDSWLKKEKASDRSKSVLPGKGTDTETRPGRRGGGSSAKRKRSLTSTGTAVVP